MNRLNDLNKMIRNKSSCFPENIPLPRMRKPYEARVERN